MLASVKMRSQSQPGAAVKKAIEKLNLYAATLIAGLDELQMKYEERRRDIELHKSTNIDLDLDMARFASPGLDSIEIDTLKHLSSISLAAARPQQPPFPTLAIIR